MIGKDHRNLLDCLLDAIEHARGVGVGVGGLQSRRPGEGAKIARTTLSLI
jgi:hypothetical protein